MTRTSLESSATPGAGGASKARWIKYKVTRL
eukprot:CAMPEP_0195088326 /NCGR_PEP_ID=MMETSP0448-20130528/27930_1 /TAXON_ID=66468 /ORGANISM="Heterocapsa triquestra, Strain CCMP 448" /LENGTH=30 /DNA_ID= /DNA_START= /DNA_END= /DNA_ORIENTATION=